MKLTKESDIMTTGWAVVEVIMRNPVVENTEAILDKGLQMDFLKKYGATADNLESVQWCEAKAVLEAIKNVK